MAADDTCQYPLFTPEPLAKLHLRAFPNDAAATRMNDIAACAATLVAEGCDVIVAAEHRPSMVSAIGLGWREPLLAVFHTGSLLELTAELYTVWARSPRRGVAVVVEDWMALGTRPDGTHDDGTHDDDAIEWLRAARDGDDERLCGLTGLSYTGYLRRSDPPTPSPATLVIGCRYRRFADGRTLNGLMGGSMVTEAHTVVNVSVDPSTPHRRHDGELVVGTATMLKPADAARTVEVTRPLQMVHAHWKAA